VAPVSERLAPPNAAPNGGQGTASPELAGPPAPATTLDWGKSGLAAAACAFYLAFAELCEFSYHRAVLPVWPLASKGS
jgi:hypothetical protein